MQIQFIGSLSYNQLSSLMSVSDFIRNFRSLKVLSSSISQDDSIDIQEIKRFVNAKSVGELDKGDSLLMNDLIHIINLLFDEGDTNELFGMMVQICKNAQVPVQTTALNNICVFLFTANLIDLAKKIAKFTVARFHIDKPQVHLISYLNLARIYYFYSKYAKSLQMTEKALLQYEPYVFKEMKANSLQYQKNPQDIILLLNGYLFYGKCVQHLQVQGQQTEVDYAKFYQNGAKLAKKYLCQTHYLQRVFSSLERVGPSCRRNISNYITQKRTVQRQVNLRKMTLLAHGLLGSLREQFTQVSKGSQVKKQISQRNFRVKSTVDNSGKRSEQKNELLQSQQSQEFSQTLKRVQSPQVIKSLHASKPQPQIDIEQIIQKKFETFVATFNSKKSEPKIFELERKVDELTKENQKIQLQRQDREKEIEDLKEKINLLSSESTRIRTIINKQDQQKEASPLQSRDSFAFGKAVQSMKKQSTRPRTSVQNEINNIINNLNNEPEVKESPSNSMSINDTDYTVDQNLTIMDQVDGGKQYNIPLNTDQTVVKKVLLENQLYELSCCMVHRNKELALKITASQGSETPRQGNKSEYVEVSIIKDLIQYIEYYKVLPYTTPIKAITNFKIFVQYLILPFISISKEDEQKVSIYSYPQSLLQDPDKIYMYEEPCSVTLHFLESTTFRLVVSFTQNKQVSSALIDLHFDKSSCDLFFESSFSEEFEREEVQELTRILEGQEKSNDTVKNKHRVYAVQNYIIKNQDRFMQFLEKIKTDIEELMMRTFGVTRLQDMLRVLNGQQVTLPNKSQAKIQICQVKVWEKAVYQRITLLADNSREQCYEIYQQNCFETFAPRGQKVKAEGYTQFSYDQVTNRLGLNPSLIDAGDQLIVCNILSNLFTLNTFAKELDLDDYDRFKNNAIIELELHCESCSRQFLSKCLNNQAQNYKVPITMSYLGIQDVPFGIRIQVFDDISLTEQGLFLTISPNVWEASKKDEGSRKVGKKSAKFITRNKMTSEFYLTDLLNKIGWQIIRKSITISAMKDKMIASRTLANKSVSYTDRLENVLNTQGLVELLTSKTIMK